MAAYVSNRDLLREIHKSKQSYCAYFDGGFDYDIIVAKASHGVVHDAHRIVIPDLSQLEVEMGNGSTPLMMAMTRGKKERSAIIVREMTDAHVPDAVAKSAAALAKRKSPPRAKITVNFAAFRHVTLDGVEVARSHWIGSADNGHFSQDHGRMTNELGRMFMKMTARFGTKGSFRGYSYLSEMAGKAHIDFCRFGLKFDESKSSSPFSYYTQLIKNAFRAILNDEKRVQMLRDEVLIANGCRPSYSRQMMSERIGDELRDQ